MARGVYLVDTHEGESLTSCQVGPSWEIPLPDLNYAHSVAQRVGLCSRHFRDYPNVLNDDRTNGVAAALAAGQRYHDTGTVSTMDLAERQYATYADHLLCLTHGDYAKKTMRKMGEIMRSEARELYGQTRHSSLFVGHLHHRSRDMVDESGRVIYQTPSPVPIDAYHEQSGYVGSRKGIQLVLLDREGGGDRIIHA